ncbi:prepilin peptidase [Paenibacillus sp. PAMC21692]|uniref:A24 family peptidase n=1 Tax=Paenibacillus sp. PAMC21692 TaxID=2762320 RepID=UPI00164E81F5|nr:A24 family peptidase [Paenibacillus sp. PAMC21692]QNK59703.1 prepilin peptidase [Paenibacillus sp. PAMC21692]
MSTSFALAALLLLLVAAFITDMRWRRIPNWLTFTFFVAGLLYHISMDGGAGLAAASWGATAGFLPLLLLYALGGIGAGDVKLFGAAGAWIGVGTVLQLMMASIVCAGIIGLLLLAGRMLPSVAIKKAIRYLTESDAESDTAIQSHEKGSRKVRSRPRMPFMIAVLPAVALVWPSLT